jgi:hypothetical protein
MRCDAMQSMAESIASPVDGCERWLRSVRGRAALDDNVPKDVGVQAFALIEATAIPEARRKKANARKRTKRLKKFQELFERELEEQQRALMT